MAFPAAGKLDARSTPFGRVHGTGDVGHVIDGLYGAGLRILLCSGVQDVRGDVRVRLIGL